VVPENIHTLPMDGHWKFQGGGGSERPKFLKESMKLSYNFQRNGGAGSMDIFWNHTITNREESSKHNM